VLRVVINSFAFVILTILGVVTLQFNLPLGALLLLSTIDQLEDVYYYVYGKRLMPKSLMPLDVVLELVLAFVGMVMFITSLIYYQYFPTWFFKALLPLSFLIVYSAVEDVVEWFTPSIAPSVAAAPTTPPLTVSHYVCLKEEVREEEGFRFIRRKH
jgi:hypothetical protein